MGNRARSQGLPMDSSVANHLGTKAFTKQYDNENLFPGPLHSFTTQDEAKCQEMEVQESKVEEH